MAHEPRHPTANMETPVPMTEEEWLAKAEEANKTAKDPRPNTPFGDLAERMLEDGNPAADVASMLLLTIRNKPHIFHDAGVPQDIIDRLRAAAGTALKSL